VKASIPVAALALAVLSGCATAPFADPEPYTSADSDPDKVPAAFAARVAPRFEQVNAVVFHFRRRAITALGMAAVDRPARAFTVTCMTPLGVKLFDVVCRGGRAEGRFVHPALERFGGDLAQAAATDLARAYLDWQPPPGATATAARDRLVFTAADAAGTTAYRYAGRDGRLAEKVRVEDGRRRWSVAYRDYAQDSKGLVPRGLVIENRQYGYRLVVTTRD